MAATTAVARAAPTPTADDRYGGGGGSSSSKAGATGVVHTQGGAPVGNGKIVLTFLLPPKTPTPQAPVGNQAQDVSQIIGFTCTLFNETGDSTTGFDFRYRVQSTSTWTTVAHVTSTASQYFMPANTLTAGNIYEWQVRVTGQRSGTASDWSSSGFLTAVAPPSAPSVITPAVNEIIGQTSYTVSWTAVGGQQEYALQIYGDSGGTYDPSNLIYDSGGLVQSATTSHRSLCPPEHLAHVRVAVVVGGALSLRQTLRFP